MAISVGTGKLKATQSAKQVLLSCLQLQLSACGQNKVVVTGISNPTYYIEKLLSISLAFSSFSSLLIKTSETNDASKKEAVSLL